MFSLHTRLPLQTFAHECSLGKEREIGSSGGRRKEPVRFVGGGEEEGEEKKTTIRACVRIKVHGAMNGDSLSER